MSHKHRKGCTSGWDGSCVVGCWYHPDNAQRRRLETVREASGVESKFIDEAAARRWRALKFVSPGLRGVPDRMVLKGLREALVHFKLWGGYTDDKKAEADLRELLAMIIEFAELKRPFKDATLQQMRRHEEFRNLGFKTAVIDTPAGVEEWYADRS